MNEEAKRKKTILKKIKKLGILDIDVHKIDGANSMNLNDIESVVAVLEKHQKEYPPEYEATYLDFVKAVRENVWKNGSEFSRFYFDMSALIFWGLKKLNFRPNKGSEVCENILDVDKLHGIYKGIAKRQHD